MKIESCWSVRCPSELLDDILRMEFQALLKPKEDAPHLTGGWKLYYMLTAGGLSKRNVAASNQELLPLNSKPTQPSNNIMGSPPPKSLYGRLKASIGANKSSAVREQLATEV